MAFWTFHRVWLRRYSNTYSVLKTLREGVGIECLANRSNVPKVRLTTDRLVVRLVHDRDAWRLADYYAENRHFLKPWEPVRDESHCYPSGWQARLGMINNFINKVQLSTLVYSTRTKKRLLALPNFPMLFAALFMPAISVIRLGKNGRAKDSCLKP